MNKTALNFRTSNDFGYSAYDAYAFLAKKYGWQISVAGNFKPLHLLYAKGATPEGYSVWFVAHSNFISEDDTNGLWKNTIKKDLICEEWLGDSAQRRTNLILDETTRVVFAKKSSGKYYFMGVYELKEIKKNDAGNYERIYKKNSEVYPMS